MRLLRALGSFFLLVGFTLLLFVAYEVIGTSIIEHRHQRALSSAFDKLPAQPRAARAAGPPPKEGSPIARIHIPKINVNQIVVEGTTLNDLVNGPGHYRGTPLPWQLGSTAIAGHRTGWGSPFINIDRLRENDTVVLETKYGTFTYRITGKVIVERDAVWVLAGDPHSKTAMRLTLTTCTPKYTSLHRMIYWADLVSERLA